MGRHAPGLCRWCYARPPACETREIPTVTAGFNDNDKQLDILAGLAADTARRGGTSATAALAPGPERSSFEDISMSPSILLRSNDLAGTPKVMRSNTVPATPVGEVPLLWKKKGAAPGAAAPPLNHLAREGDRRPASRACGPGHAVRGTTPLPALGARTRRA